MTRKTVSFPALLEVEGDSFAPLDAVLLSPKLQAQLVNPGQFKQIVARLRKYGLVSEIPYIGPNPAKA